MDLDLTKYLPIAAAILSATLGYLFGIRTKKNDRLILFTEENLKEAFSPAYHEMRKIVSSSVKPRDRELMLDNFFRKYAETDTSIYKLGNVELLDTFYELNESYERFKLSREEKLWNEFWYDFENIFYYKVRKGYRNSTELLYRDFKWQQYIQGKPYWMKFYFESMKFLFETVKGVNVVSLLLLYFSGSSEIFGIGLFQKDFWLFSLIVLGLSVMITLVLIPPNMQYITLSSNSKKSFSRRLMKKTFPKILNRWDKFIIKKDYSTIPKMHDKRFFNDEQNYCG